MVVDAHTSAMCSAHSLLLITNCYYALFLYVFLLPMELRTFRLLKKQSTIRHEMSVGVIVIFEYKTSKESGAFYNVKCHTH